VPECLSGPKRFLSPESPPTYEQCTSGKAGTRAVCRSCFTPLVRAFGKEGERQELYLSHLIRIAMEQQRSHSLHPRGRISNGEMLHPLKPGFFSGVTVKGLHEIYIDVCPIARSF
jgi:hypothetical protein